jgi:hypothetical protein
VALAIVALKLEAREDGLRWMMRLMKRKHIIAND